MLESEIIEKYMGGEYKGITFDGDFAYIPLRLTGTGKVERVDDDLARIVDRKMELFSLSKFMKAYSNLPVVLNHPTNEYGEFIRASIETPEHFIGNTIHSYIIDNEIWVIARIHNKEVIEYISSNDVSTSPHFITKELKEDDYFVEIPNKINSLAIVANGFWDKKSVIPPVDNSEFNIINDKGDIMGKETKEELEKVDSVMEKEASSETEKEEKVDTDAKEENVETEDKKEEKVDEVPSEISVKDEVQELINNEAQEANHFEELAKQHDKFKGEKVESDLMQGDWSEDDDMRDELLAIMTDVVDSAPKEVMVKKIYVGERLKPHAVIKRFVSANSKLVDSKYQGLINKIDSSDMVEIGRDIINNIKKNIELKARELNKPVESNSRVTIHKDGTKSFKIL